MRAHEVRALSVEGGDDQIERHVRKHVELNTILLTKGVACGTRCQGQVNQARIAIGGARGTRTLCLVDGYSPPVCT